VGSITGILLGHLRRARHRFSALDVSHGRSLCMAGHVSFRHSSFGCHQECESLTSCISLSRSQVASGAGLGRWPCSGADLALALALVSLPFRFFGRPSPSSIPLL
jgi:hypothetical protein